MKNEQCFFKKIDDTDLDRITDGEDGDYILCFGGEKEYEAAKITVHLKENLNLILAAPQLLEALQELRKCYCETGKELTIKQTHHHIYTLVKVEKAIKKAIGKP